MNKAAGLPKNISCDERKRVADGVDVAASTLDAADAGAGLEAVAPMAEAAPLASDAAARAHASDEAGFSGSVIGRTIAAASTAAAQVCASGSDAPVGRAGPSGEAPRCRGAPRSRSQEGVQAGARVELAELAHARGESGLITEEGDAPVGMLVEHVLQSSSGMLLWGRTGASVAMVGHKAAPL